MTARRVPSRFPIYNIISRRRLHTSLDNPFFASILSGFLSTLQQPLKFFLLPPLMRKFSLFFPPDHLPSGTISLSFIGTDTNTNSMLAESKLWSGEINVLRWNVLDASQIQGCRRSRVKKIPHTHILQFKLCAQQQYIYLIYTMNLNKTNVWNNNLPIVGLYACTVTMYVCLLLYVLSHTVYLD